MSSKDKGSAGDLITSQFKDLPVEGAIEAGDWGLRCLRREGNLGCYQHLEAKKTKQINFKNYYRKFHNIEAKRFNGYFGERKIDRGASPTTVYGEHPELKCVPLKRKNSRQLSLPHTSATFSTHNGFYT